MKFNSMLSKVSLLPVAACMGVASFALSPMVSAAGMDDWTIDAQIYLWAAGISGQTSSGGDVDIGFSDIWDNLDMAFMGGLSARNGKWAFMTDPSYVKISGSNGWTENVPAGPFNIPVNVRGAVQLESWITNVGVGYEILNTETDRVNLLAGARYLSMDVDVQLDLTGIVTTHSRSISESESNWDGIIGVAGVRNIDKQWSIQYRLDAGAGDSDSTVNAVAVAAYQMGWGQVFAGYRYLHYEFDNDNVGILMNDLTVDGPVIGAQFTF